MTGWHRFVGESGSKIYESCPYKSRQNGTLTCGTENPGWMRNWYTPTVADGVVTRELYFNKDYCYRHSSRVDMRNCGNFFIYQFVFGSIDEDVCNFSICTM